MPNSKDLASWIIETDRKDEYQVDPDIVYPLFLDALDEVGPTQSGLEAARYCFTRALSQSVKADGPILLTILIRPRWALKKYAIGDPTLWDLRRDHYERMKATGSVPK